MDVKNKLTDENFWNETWANLKLPQAIRDKGYPYSIDILNNFFHEYLPHDSVDFLELGCAPGRWMHYFSKDFGYRVSGLDNSEVGVATTKKNLEILNIAGGIYSGDVLTYKFNREFDVVFSMGLVEHFSDLNNIIEKHLNLTREGGFIIIGIPNLKKSLYWFLQRIINKRVLDLHILLNADDLLKLLEGKNILVCKYVGVFNLGLLSVPSGSIMSKILHRIGIIINKILRTLMVKRETAFLSPYIFAILKK